MTLMLITNQVDEEKYKHSPEGKNSRHFRKSGICRHIHLQQYCQQRNWKDSEVYDNQMEESLFSAVDSAPVVQVLFKRKIHFIGI